MGKSFTEQKRPKRNLSYKRTESSGLAKPLKINATFDKMMEALSHVSSSPPRSKAYQFDCVTSLLQIVGETRLVGEGQRARVTAEAAQIRYPSIALKREWERVLTPFHLFFSL